MSRLNTRNTSSSDEKNLWLGRFLVWGLPVFWVTLFFLIPILIILKISFAESIFAAPPYTEMLTWIDDVSFSLNFNLANYLLLFQDSLYLAAYLNSIAIAATATILCTLIAFPMAYGIARSNPRYRSILLLLIILPFWTSFLIRVYAWIGLLGKHGIINSFLMNIGLISEPLPLIYNNFSVLTGLVYSYLPFMILPLYSALEKMDRSTIEAAQDLGARPFAVFRNVILPLSMPGIISGSMLVFIPAVGEFVIPELLGGQETLMIGRILWFEFFQNQDWPMASAIAIALAILLVLPITILQRFQAQERAQ